MGKNNHNPKQFGASIDLFCQHTDIIISGIQSQEAKRVFV